MRPLVIFVFLLFTGCAGVGVTSSSDPNVKLQQANALIAQDRAVLAEDLIKQAMSIYKSRNDKLGMAEAYHAFGNLYMSRAYHGKNSATFKKLGSYDGTYNKAVEHLLNAKKLFAEVNSEVGVVKTLVSVANAHIEKSESKIACKYYTDALSRYQAGKASGAIISEPQIFDKRFSNMGQIINAYIKHYNCHT